MIASFRRALAGVRVAVRCERNLRIQLCVAVYVILFGGLAGLETWAWAACLICIGMVLGAELLNTAIERVCDRVCPEYSGFIRLSKDAAAGGVLMAAVLSAAVGCLVFFRPETLSRLWTLCVSRPWLTAIPVMLLIPCAFFVKRTRKGMENPWKSKNPDSSRS